MFFYKQIFSHGEGGESQQEKPVTSATQVRTNDTRGGVIFFLQKGGIELLKSLNSPTQLIHTS